MSGFESFPFQSWDYLSVLLYFLAFSFVGLWAGRKRHEQAGDYFLAGRTLPWYVVGGSYVASNISSEHFIGMVGAAFIYGLCVAWAEWGNILAFSLLIWFFIPFLLASGVFTTPEYLEKRFSPFLRQSFAVVTVISNITAFLAAVLYGGGLAIQKLFDAELTRLIRPVATILYGPDLSPAATDDLGLWFAILVLGLVAGAWTIYGGLSSVAWTDFFALVLMVVGGLLVTVLGILSLSPDGWSLVEGWRVMIERNQAREGLWADFVRRTAPAITGADHYNRLSIVQPAAHTTSPWPSLVLDTFSVGIWYNVINQFMIQRVLGARSMYHARMGIVFAGYLKMLMPLLVVVPGLVLFAHPASVDLLNAPLDRLQGGGADRGYMHLLQVLLPAGIRGLFLAALLGAIQSTVNSVLNSTATVLTLDIYRRHWAPQASERHLVRVGKWTTVVVLGISILLAGWIRGTNRPLFVYIQELYAFFAPPFSAVFLLGILSRRINAQAAVVTVISGFGFGIALKACIAWAAVPAWLAWIRPFAMQGIANWAVCTILCVAVSLATRPPRPHQVTADLTIHWDRLNILDDLGRHWYSHVALWWAVSALGTIALTLAFSGLRR